MGIGIVEVTLIAVLLVTWICGNILRKAGFSRWLALLLFVPLLNIALIWVFAFSRWPSLDARRALLRELR